MASRLSDWQQRLAVCVAARANLPFAWGSQDCALFAADCVLACTGEDIATDVRGRYKTDAGAARFIKRLGGLAAIAAARLGPEVAPLMAQPGDVGLLENAGNPCLAVWTGAVWHAPAEQGLTPFPIECATRAWRCCAEDF